MKLSAKGGHNTQAGSGGSRATRQLRQQQSKLCRAGVPQALRARVWLALSESRRVALMMAAGEKYSQLLARATHAVPAKDEGGATPDATAGAAAPGPLEVTFRSIEADLARTFPDHQMVDTAEVLYAIIALCSHTA